MLLAYTPSEFSFIQVGRLLTAVDSAMHSLNVPLKRFTKLLQERPFNYTFITFIWWMLSSKAFSSIKAPLIYFHKSTMEIPAYL